MTDNFTAAAGDQIKAFIERIERVAEERKALGDDLRDIYAEAKGNGFDTKAIKHIVALRAKDPNQVKEFEAVLDLYKAAIGMDP